jgi:hypothetical protein
MPRQDKGNIANSEKEAAKHGMTLPYVPGSERPKWGDRREKVWLDDEKTKISPSYLIEERDRIIDFSDQHFNYYGFRWPMEADMLKGTVEQAKHFGIDLTTFAPETLSLKDIRDFDQLIEATNETLEVLMKRINDGHERAIRLLDTAKKKRWVDTLQKILEIRELCREKDHPKLDSKSPEGEAWRYIHTLRFAMYVGRSDITGKFDFIQLPNHLILADLVKEIAYEYREEAGIQGVMIVIPPRHGKSWYMIFDEILSICQEPDSNGAIVHNSEDMAASRLKVIKEHFNDQMPSGRRRRALFPEIEMDWSVNNSQTMILKNRKVMSMEGNCNSYGLHGKRLGVTIHRLRGDDVIDQKECREAATRQRTNETFTKVWMSRLTSKKAFFFLIGTRWHDDDILGRMIRMLRAGQTNFAYLSIPAGGPEEDFTPIWPEAGYDSKFLERWYYSLGPNDFSCIFQNDPDTKASRKISKLWFYDKEWFDDVSKAPEHIQRFFARGQYVMSVDPAGTDARRSNKAGMTYCVHGPMEVLLPSGLIVEQHVCWFLKNWDMTASQFTIAGLISDFYEQRRRPDGSHEVDKIIVETTGGFHATTEMLVNVKGVPDSVVSKRAPGRGNKIDRFLQYSALIEGGRVFFPGIYSQSLSGSGETELTMDPDWSEAANQMLRAGTVSDLNLLDCISQQLADIAHVFLEDNVLGHPELLARDRAAMAKIRKDKKDLYERKLRGDTKARRRRRPGSSIGFLTQIRGKNWG